MSNNTKVTIIGSGKMARGIATRFLAGGTSVTLVGRSPEKVGDLAAQLRGSSKSGASVDTAGYGSAIGTEVVVLAVPYPADVSVVKEYGTKLNGKTVISISTPFNASYDGLVTSADTSAAEEVAKAAPGAKVVKAFNTNFAGMLVAGTVGGHPLDVFVAGDDAAAKAGLVKLLESAGFRPLDVGPLQRSRYLEGLHLINAGLQSHLEKPWMNAIKFLS